MFEFCSVVRDTTLFVFLFESARPIVWIWIWKSRNLVQIRYKPATRPRKGAPKRYPTHHSEYSYGWSLNGCQISVYSSNFVRCKVVQLSGSQTDCVALAYRASYHERIMISRLLRDSCDKRLPQYFIV